MIPSPSRRNRLRTGGDATCGANGSAHRRLRWGSVLARALASVLVVQAVVAGPAAEAHSATGSPSSNYTTTITSITPRPTGFEVRSIERGSRLEVRWLSGESLVVAGYEDEPYLRIGPDGVEENLRSPATYLNRDRNGTTASPETTDAAAEPQWSRAGTEPVARFHDHRAHYMGSVPPDAVSNDPGIRRTIQTFEVPITQAGVSYVVAGRVEWVPGPTAVVYLLVAGLLAAGLVAAAAWAGTRPARRRAIRVPLSSAVGALVAVDVFHLFGIAAGVAGGSVLGRTVSIGFASIAAWGIALLSVALWWKGRADALYLTTFAAGLMTLVGGVADVSILSRSSLVFGYSATLARWSVAATLGLGLGLVIACVLLTRPVSIGEQPV